jgi:hypothetical protein
MRNDDRILEALIAAIACVTALLLILTAAWRV